MIEVPERIKLICRDDTARKNFRVMFPNGEHDDLVNENIASESLSMTESLCSGDELVFGMCEASVIEFDCDISENITGVVIKTQLEIDISDEPEEFIAEYGQTSDDVDFPFYAINYGEYIVKSCKQNSKGLRHIQGYTQIIGDSKITSTGSEDFLEWGLSPIEIYKMTYPVANSNYYISIKKFVYSNIEGMEPPADKSEYGYASNEYAITESLPITGVKFPDGSVHKVTSATFVPTVGTDPFGAKTYGWKIWTGNEYSSMLLYLEANGYEESKIAEWVTDFVTENFGEGAELVFSGGTDLDSLASSLFSPKFGYGAYSSTGEWSYYSYCRFPMSSKYLDPFTTNPPTSQKTWAIKLIYEASILLTVDGTTYTSTVYDNEDKVPGLYFDNNSVETDPKIISFPRTLKVSKKKYILDYKALFRDGIEVTKKDKKGTSTTKTYSFSFSDLMEGYAELNCAFGSYWRKEGNYAFKPVGKLEELVPTGALYPSDSVYPNGSVENINSRIISSLSIEDSLTKPYGKVTCTCTPDGADAEEILEVDILDGVDDMDEDTYLVYDMSDNYIIKAFPDSEVQILEYMSKVASALSGMRWMPATVSFVGLPYVENGDWVEFVTPSGTYKTNVLRQTISGIQNLTTTIESE